MITSCHRDLNMVDSVKVVNEDVLRRIHANYAGRLHKGHGIVAANTSIPTKYQTIIIDNGDRKGFNAKSKRFSDNVLNENPGPGSYVGHNPFKGKPESTSKKGYGGFVSKDRRVARTQVPSGPGAGKYGLPSLLQKRTDFNKANTGNFHQPIAQPHNKQEVLPAPGSYDPKQVPKGKVNNVHAGAAFKSGTKRESCLEDKRGNPAPGQYETQNNNVQPNPKTYDSSFKSRADRDLYRTNQNPGPGAYKPNEAVDPANKTLFPKKHYLCLSAPAMPLPPPPLAPGPGAYDLRDYEGPARHYMSSSVFVSSSSRWHDMSSDRTIPGPGAYHPVKPTKESFIYNHAQKWI